MIIVGWNSAHNKSYDNNFEKNGFDLTSNEHKLTQNHNLRCDSLMQDSASQLNTI